MSHVIKEVFEQVSCKLKELCWVKRIDLYFKQDSDSSKAQPYQYPYIMLDFQNVEINVLGNSQVQYTFDMTIKIIVNDFTRNQFKIFDYSREVAYHMFNYFPLQFSILHQREQLDTDATNIYEYQIYYTVNCYDDFSYHYASTSGLGLILDLEIDGNNDNIYSSWAGTSGTID